MTAVLVVKRSLSTDTHPKGGPGDQGSGQNTVPRLETQHHNQRVLWQTKKESSSGELPGKCHPANASVLDQQPQELNGTFLCWSKVPLCGSLLHQLGENPQPESVTELVFSGSW